jgi:hypothetical protein
VTCSAACEVRVDLPDRFAAPAYFELAHAGTRVASLEGLFTAIAPVRRGPVRVRVRYAAPGARSATERVETVTLERTEVGAPPKVLGLKAVRHGSRVDVTWRANKKADSDAFAVVGSPNRTFDIENLAVAEAHSAGGQRFKASLKSAKEIEYVFVFAGSDDSIGGPYVVKVS